MFLVDRYMSLWSSVAEVGSLLGTTENLPIPKNIQLLWKYFGSGSGIAKNYRVRYWVPVWHWWEKEYHHYVNKKMASVEPWYILSNLFYQPLHWLVLHNIFWEFLQKYWLVLFDPVKISLYQSQQSSSSISTTSPPYRPPYWPTCQPPCPPPCHPRTDGQGDSRRRIAEPW